MLRLDVLVALLLVSLPLTAGLRASSLLRAGRPMMKLPAVGTQCTPTVINALGVGGKRAVVAFVNSDDGFACAKHLLALSQAADAFAQRSCTLTAVRPPKGARCVSAVCEPPRTQENPGPA